MSPPGEAARRLLLSCMLGILLGTIYAFLRPLRRKRNWPADFLFLLCSLRLWTVLTFGICRANLRAGNLLAFGGCAVLWNLWAGPVMAGIFYPFWGGIYRFFRFLFLPFQKAVKLIGNFSKNHYAILKKCGTIGGYTRKQDRHDSGGVTHGKEKNISSRL